MEVLLVLGFLALAALIFGQWKPLRNFSSNIILWICINISKCITSNTRITNIPLVVLKVFPYVVTLIALIIFSRSSQAPKAAGEPFDAGKEIELFLKRN